MPNHVRFAYFPKMGQLYPHDYQNQVLLSLAKIETKVNIFLASETSPIAR